MIKILANGHYNHFVGVLENFKTTDFDIRLVSFKKSDIVSIFDYKIYDKKSNILGERFEGLIQFENQELLLFSPMDSKIENNEYYALFYERSKNKFYTLGENNVRFYKEVFPLEINLKYYNHIETETISVPDIRTLKIPEKKSESQSLF